MFDECLLNCVQLVITRGNSFDCFDRGATDLGNGHETTVDDPPVDHYRARATLTFAAALFGSSQAKLFTQHIQQPLHRIRIERALPAINCTVDLNFCRQEILVAAQAGSDGSEHITFDALGWIEMKSGFLQVPACGDEIVVVIERLNVPLDLFCGLSKLDAGALHSAASCGQTLKWSTVH